MCSQILLNYHFSTYWYKKNLKSNNKENKTWAIIFFLGIYSTHNIQIYKIQENQKKGGALYWTFTNILQFQCYDIFKCYIVSIYLAFSDSKKEKAIRSSIKSDIQRKLDSNDLLIFDGSNYIKGYRYEIYCTTKLYETPQCTLYCNLPIEQAWLWNNKRLESDRYDREIFDSLVSRWWHNDNNNSKKLESLNF